MYVAQGSGPCSCIRVAITTRQASAVTIALVNSITITSTIALITLFRILSSFNTLLIKSFYIAFFISFINII